MADPKDVPAWAEPEVFPAKPESSKYGALSGRRGRSDFESLEALSAHVRSSRDSVDAVWTPETERTVPPEAVPGLLEPLRHRFVTMAEADASDARRNSLIFGAMLAWAVYAAIANGRPPQQSAVVGLAALLFVIFGVYPWYEAWKDRKQAWELNEEALTGEEEEARFDRWLLQQRAWMTKFLLGLLALTGALQIWVGLNDSVAAAGLDKALYQRGEWWRLLTAPFLHGNPLHWGLNAAGLFYLGRRVETLAGWPHLLVVYLMAMTLGGVASAEFMPDRPSVGASGGILGLLGFLLVFETLHPRLVPHPTRRRLFAALFVTFLVGFLVRQFIDNYAHGGGLAAGVLYAAIVFPSSRSARRPKADLRDQAVGAVALVILTAAALFAGWRMLAWG